MEFSGVQLISKLEDRLRQATADFQQSREFIKLHTDFDPGADTPYCMQTDRGPEKESVSLDLKDILVIGGITNSDVLFTGKSGGGKTHLAKMTMNALFGSDGFESRTITPGMNEDAFLDIDFGAIKAGSTQKDAIKPTNIILAPGVVLNEVNRTPKALQNIFIPYLEYEFNVKGLNFKTGVPLPNGQRYQYRILTMNEGDQYVGTTEVDAAVRDRMVIEIPIDQFRPLKQDIREMIKGRKSSSITVDVITDPLKNEVIDLHQKISKIPLSEVASEFLVYMNGLSNCIKSITGSKEGINFKPERMCQGCKHSAEEGNICGNVYAPTNRSLINLENVAKGVAAVRAYKTLATRLNSADSDSKRQRLLAEFMEGDLLNGLAVSCEDLIAVAPFVLYSKLQVNDKWLNEATTDGGVNRFQGNKFVGIQFIVDHAFKRFSKLFREHGQILMRNTPEDEDSKMVFLRKYAEEKDAWLANIKDLEHKTPKINQSLGGLILSYKPEK